jgi:heptosyltransferase-2
MPETRKILIIQTASIGDVILATPLVESLRLNFPGARIDFLVKRGNEPLLENHPGLGQVLVWDKKNAKIRNLLSIIRRVRKEKYDMVVNVQRFFSSGLMTVLSGAPVRAGFDKNPLSPLFTHRAEHVIGRSGIHETDRNLALISEFIDKPVNTVRLYPSEADFSKVSTLKDTPYVCIAPASLWFTKQYPKEKWIELIRNITVDYKVYLLGSGNDHRLCEEIAQGAGRAQVVNLSGSLTFLQSAALMKDAVMNFVNDSAPLHLASAVNAPVTAIFCSTVPEFGFGPLSEGSLVVETRKPLPCRPCGLHGFRECPEEHFACAMTIDNQELLNRIQHD